MLIKILQFLPSLSAKNRPILQYKSPDTRLYIHIQNHTFSSGNKNKTLVIFLSFVAVTSSR